ncbi:hypothetical protein [Agrococcus baldri]|nr:hypothetical protein [Agrococcus baldri]
MPEFEMPAAVESPPRSEPAEPTTARPDHTAEPGASDTPARRSGLGWRHVLIGVVVGAVVGAAIPGGVQLAERTAASADSDGLRAVATAYLTAIADGRAEDATAMAPLPGAARGAPDAVLQSAERIADGAVRLVHIDGDAATVEVSYDVGQRDMTRTLEAQRVEGAWHLTSSLTEPAAAQSYGSSINPQVAGFAMPATTPVHLYPGTYGFDELDDPMLRSSAGPFVVDGDPSTPVESYFEPQLAPGLSARAGDIGVALGTRCQADPSCSLQPGAEVQYGGTAWVQEVTETDVSINVQMVLGGERVGNWFEVRIRILRDDAGEPAQWLCAPIGGYAVPSEPCPEP